MDYKTRVDLIHVISFVAFLTFIIYIVNYLFVEKVKNLKGRQSYECGCAPKNFKRKGLNVKFFVICVRFLIFDLEMIRRWPVVRALPYLPLKGVVTFLYFYIIVNLGFFYEWRQNALKI